MWRLAVGALIVVLVYWLFFRRKSGYTKPDYKPDMTMEELSKEFNRAAGEMTAETEILKMMPGNETNIETITDDAKKQYDELNKEFELEKAKLVKAAEPVNDQTPAVAPPEVPSTVVNVPPEPQTSEIQVVSPPSSI